MTSIDNARIEVLKARSLYAKAPNTQRLAAVITTQKTLETALQKDFVKNLGLLANDVAIVAGKITTVNA